MKFFFFCIVQEFLSTYADDRGLRFEFSDITDCFHEQDFLLPVLQIPLPSLVLTNQTLNTANDSTSHTSLMETTTQSPVTSPSDIYGKIIFSPIQNSNLKRNIFFQMSYLEIHYLLPPHQLHPTSEQIILVRFNTFLSLNQIHICR
jgi:hypothetical protein